VLHEHSIERCDTPSSGFVCSRRIEDITFRRC
jgi:hypothetical protein